MSVLLMRQFFLLIHGAELATHPGQRVLDHLAKEGKQRPGTESVQRPDNAMISCNTRLSVLPFDLLPPHAPSLLLLPSPYLTTPSFSSSFPSVPLIPRPPTSRKCRPLAENGSIRPTLFENWASSCGNFASVEPFLAYDRRTSGSSPSTAKRIYFAGAEWGVEACKWDLDICCSRTLPWATSQALHLVHMARLVLLVALFFIYSLC